MKREHGCWARQAQEIGDTITILTRDSTQIRQEESLMRIISLLASATEMVAALGCLDQMVGRSHECDYPPEIGALPVVSTVQIDLTTSSAEIDAQVKQRTQKKDEPEDPALKALSIYAIDV